MAEADGNRTRQGAFAPSTVLKTAEPTRRSDTSDGNHSPITRQRRSVDVRTRCNLRVVSDRDFGVLIRQSRERLGLTPARVAELIGRAPGTVRAWEKGTSTPGDAAVVSTLAAVLGIDEVALFEAAGLEPPVSEPGPSMRQALSSITPEARREHRDDPVDRLPFEAVDDEPGGDGQVEQAPPPVAERRRRDVPRPAPAPVAGPPVATAAVAEPTREPRHRAVGGGVLERLRSMTLRRGTVPIAAPTTLPPAPRVASYVEDPGERLSYRLRTVYTAAGVLALFVALAWAASNLFDSLGSLWQELTANL